MPGLAVGLLVKMNSTERNRWRAGDVAEVKKIRTSDVLIHFPNGDCAYVLHDEVSTFEEVKNCPACGRPLEKSDQ